MNIRTSDDTHPAWLTAGATVAGYGLVLVFLFVLLFLVPYWLF